MARLLVIDDDPHLLNLLEGTLTAAGHEVRCAGNGKEGLALFVKQPADLVITDLLMPEKDGLEIIQELLARDANLKIIAMTGSPTEWNLVTIAETIGAQKTLLKPFTQDEVTEAVATLLQSQ